MTSKAKTPSAETIEGDAVEKPATAKSSDHRTTTPAKSDARVSGAIIIALVLACISIAVAAFSLYQNQYQDVPVNTATTEEVDALTLRLAALEKAVDENKLAGDEIRRDLEARIAQQAENLPKGDVVASDIAQRLAVLTDRLGEIEDTMFELTLLDSASSPSVTDDANQPVQQDNVASAETTDSNGLLSRASPQPVQPATILSHASLVAVSGLMADNMAGRPVGQWYDVLQALVAQGALDFDMETLSVALVQAPPSRSNLLGDADHVIAAMADSLQIKEVDKSLLGQASAKLGKLVNLRATDHATDSPAGQLAAFEKAVMAHHFDAALQAAQTWQGHDVPELTKWQAAATARHQLDATIMQLVAAVLVDIVEAS